MARKKSRKSSHSTSQVSVVAPMPGAARPHATPAARSGGAALPKPAIAQAFWMEAAYRRVSASLGHLWCAVIGLAILAHVLAIGTVVESWYSASLAQDLIYKSWWFILLLLFLGVNILFAALKKADFRGKEAYGRDLPSNDYLSVVGFWWPWLVLVGISNGALLADIVRTSWAQNILVRFAVVPLSMILLSLLLWLVQKRTPVEAWWPWKKHQTGFLITHVGLLMMVFGGVLNWFGGTDALMATVDSPRKEHERRSGAPHITGNIFEREHSKLVVKRGSGAGEKVVMDSSFEPGSLAWRSDEHLQVKVDPALAGLHWLAHPFAQGWNKEVEEGVRLEVLNFYPHVRREEYRPATADESGSSVPALRFNMTSPMIGTLPDEWIGWYWQRDQQVSIQGPGMVELLGRCPKELLDEFLQPPALNDDQMGPFGQLVLVIDNQKTRIPIRLKDEGEEDWLPLEGTDAKVKVVSYDRNLKLDHVSNAVPYPMLRFEVKRAGRVIQYFMSARRVGELIPLPPRDSDRKGGFKAQGEKYAMDLGLQDLKAWHHPPDPRWGKDERIRAVLQVVLTEDNRIHYRSYSSKDHHFHFERSGEAVKDERLPVWDAMKWQFQITEVLPKAVRDTWYIPENHRPGLERFDLTQGIRCKLTVKRQGQDESKEFWVPRTEGPQFVSVDIGTETYQVGFHPRSRELDFKIELLRAEQTTDPGSKSAASYSSYVRLIDPKRGIDGEDRVITMNEPLEHDVYKLYQTSYTLIALDNETGKPVSRSAFTVGHDPGLILKYLGFLMLHVGIFTMFYMKAYQITNVVHLANTFLHRDHRAIAPRGDEPAQESRT